MTNKLIDLVKAEWAKILGTNADSRSIETDCQRVHPARLLKALRQIQEQEYIKEAVGVFTSHPRINSLSYGFWDNALADEDGYLQINAYKRFPEYITFEIKYCDREDPNEGSHSVEHGFHFSLKDWKIVIGWPPDLEKKKGE